MSVVTPMAQVPSKPAVFLLSLTPTIPKNRNITMGIINTATVYENSINFKISFGEFTDIHFLNCTEHIDYYGNGKCGLGSGNTYGKQSEEHSLHLPGNKNRLNTVKLISTELSINSSEINIAIIFLRVMNP